MPYLDRAIPSILGQTVADFEWVVVDDHSTDDTLAYMRRLSETEPRIRVGSTAENGVKGNSAALNLATKMATSDLLAVQDFDDISYPDRLETQIAAMAANPRIGVLGAWADIEDQATARSGIVRQAPADDRGIRLLMAQRVPFPHTLSVFRRAAWEEVGGYDTNLQTIIDLNFWISIAKAGWEMACISRPLGIHYIHAASNHRTAYQHNWRQRVLARAKLRAARELHLPLSSHLSGAKRFLISFVPKGAAQGLKSMANRNSNGSGAAQS